MQDEVVRSLEEGPDHQPDWRNRVVAIYLADIAKAQDGKARLSEILFTEKDPFVRQFLRFRYDGVCSNAAGFRYALGCCSRNAATGAGVALFASRVFALTDADTAALKQLTKDYASWDYSGRPVEFRQRLDYKSYEEQRQILLKLAEIEWNGVWGDYWRRLGVSDLKTLRAFTPKDFWVRFNRVLKPRGGTSGSSGTGRTGVDIHAITEARGDAYVVYQVSHFGRDLPSDDNFEVLRARWSDGKWRLLALPRVTAALRRQLKAAQSKKRSGG